MISFTAMVTGWTLMFTFVSVIITMVFLPFELTATVLKRAILAGASGFIMAAWFWWPDYAKVVLSAWPGRDARIWLRSSNR